MIGKEDAVHIANPHLHRVLEEGRSDQVELLPLERLEGAKETSDLVELVLLVVERVAPRRYASACLDIESRLR